MIEIHGSIGLVHLSRGAFAVIDAADVDLVRQYNWFAQRSREESSLYAVRNLSEPGKQQKLEHLLLPPPSGMLVDHKNGQTLDNRRFNLRLCTVLENARNSSVRRGKIHAPQYKGVTQNKNGGKPWMVNIGVKLNARKTMLYVGIFDTEVEAALAYDTAAKLLHGEFARLNFRTDEDVPHGVLRCTPEEFRNAEKFKRKLEKIASRVGAAYV